VKTIQVGTIDRGFIVKPLGGVGFLVTLYGLVGLQPQDGALCFFETVVSTKKSIQHYNQEHQH
jgi:hypothetical protein